MDDVGEGWGTVGGGVDDVGGGMEMESGVVGLASVRQCFLGRSAELGVLVCVWRSEEHTSELQSR